MDESSEDEDESPEKAGARNSGAAGRGGSNKRGAGSGKTEQKSEASKSESGDLHNLDSIHVLIDGLQKQLKTNKAENARELQVERERTRVLEKKLLANKPHAPNHSPPTPHELPRGKKRLAQPRDASDDDSHGRGKEDIEPDVDVVWS